jgi:hypothetical protein
MPQSGSGMARTQVMPRTPAEWQGPPQMQFDPQNPNPMPGAGGPQASIGGVSRSNSLLGDLGYQISQQPLVQIMKSPIGMLMGAGMGMNGRPGTPGINPAAGPQGMPQISARPQGQLPAAPTPQGLPPINPRQGGAGIQQPPSPMGGRPQLPQVTSTRSPEVIQNIMQLLSDPQIPAQQKQQMLASPQVQQLLQSALQGVR